MPGGRCGGGKAKPAASKPGRTWSRLPSCSQPPLSLPPGFSADTGAEKPEVPPKCVRSETAASPAPKKHTPERAAGGPLSAAASASSAWVTRLKDDESATLLGRRRQRLPGVPARRPLGRRAPFPGHLRSAERWEGAHSRERDVAAGTSHGALRRRRSRRN